MMALEVSEWGTVWLWSPRRRVSRGRRSEAQMGEARVAAILSCQRTLAGRQEERFIC